MNPKKLAEAYRTLSLGYAELADAYLDDTPIIREEPHQPVIIEAPSFDELPPDEFLSHGAADPNPYVPAEPKAAAGEGALAVCPKHRTPYKDGKYGLFCTQISDDPAWSNDKGYCRITPKNAAAYLRERSGVPA